jgi:hypothetical protein
MTGDAKGKVDTDYLAQRRFAPDLQPHAAALGGLHREGLKVPLERAGSVVESLAEKAYSVAPRVTAWRRGLGRTCAAWGWAGRPAVSPTDVAHEVGAQRRGALGGNTKQPRCRHRQWRAWRVGLWESAARAQAGRWPGWSAHGQPGRGAAKGPPGAQGVGGRPRRPTPTDRAPARIPQARRGTTLARQRLRPDPPLADCLPLRETGGRKPTRGPACAD